MGTLLRRWVLAGALGAALLHGGAAVAEDADAPAPGQRSVPVVRSEAEPPENVALRAKLREPAPDTVGRTVTLEQLVAAYRAALGVDVSTTEAALKAVRDELLPVPPAAGLSAEEQLRTALGRRGLHFGVRDGALRIGADDELVGTIDRRTYDVRAIRDVFAERALEDRRRDDPGAQPSAADTRFSAADVIGLLQNCVGPSDAWTLREQSIAAAGDSLVVDQTAEIHAGIEAFLDRLLHWTAPRTAKPAAWESRVDAALARPVTIRVLSASLGEVAARIEQQTGVAVLVDPACASRTVTLDVAGLPGRDAVRWCERAADLHAAVAAGALWLSPSPPTEIRLYDTRTSLSPWQGGFVGDSVRALIEWAHPAEFEEGGFVDMVTPDLLIMRSTRETHARVDVLLAGLREICDAQKAGTDALDGVPVVRTERESAADAAVRASLRGPAVGALAGDVAPADVPAALRERLAIGVVVEGDALRDVPGAAVHFPAAAALTLEQQLRLALWPAGVDIGVRDGVLCLGPAGDPVGAQDTRLYDVGPVLRAWEQRDLAALRATDPEADAESVRGGLGGEDLIAIVQDNVRPRDVWTCVGVAIAANENILVVRQTDAYHAATRDVLDRLLAFSRGRRADPPEWRRRLAAALARPVTLRTDEIPLREVAAQLSAALGVPVAADEDCAAVPLRVDLVDAPARDVAAWCARTAGVHVARRDGAIVFSREPELATRFYDVPGPLTNAEEQLQRVLSEVRDITASGGSAEALGAHALLVVGTPEQLDRIDLLLRSAAQRDD